MDAGSSTGAYCGNMELKFALDTEDQSTIIQDMQAGLCFPAKTAQKRRVRVLKHPGKTGRQVSSPGPAATVSALLWE